VNTAPNFPQNNAMLLRTIIDKFIYNQKHRENFNSDHNSVVILFVRY